MLAQPHSAGPPGSERVTSLISMLPFMCNLLYKASSFGWSSIKWANLRALLEFHSAELMNTSDGNVFAVVGKT